MLTGSPGAKDLDDAERLRRYQRLLLAIGRFLTSDRDLEDFLTHAVAEVAQATNVGRVKILRYRPDEGDLLVAAGVGWNEGVVGVATLPIDVTSPPGRAVQTGEATVIEDIQDTDDYRLSGLLKAHGIRGLANVPIVVNGRCWGVLEIDTTEPIVFGTDTTQFLEATAQLVATAIRRDERRARDRQMRQRLALEGERRATLLREMQHRVKNNFQLIVAMLLQQRKGASAETRAILRSLTDRVTAIALAHDQLDPSRGLAAVNLGRYLGALCRTFDGMLEGVTVATSLDEADAPIEVAISAGLIVNELVTNALKHAFDGPGTITVEFRADVGRGTAWISVSDNGKGKHDAKRTGSGTKLIETLARQIDGQVEQMKPERGTHVCVRFPLRTYREQAAVAPPEGAPRE